jgi:hypothetical protein
MSNQLKKGWAKLALLRFYKKKLEYKNKHSINVHEIVNSIKYGSDNKIISEVLKILKSSERPMPARFCNGNFAIKNNPLSESEQYELAGNVMMCMGFVKNNEFSKMIKYERYIYGQIVYLGETISLIVGLVKKLGGTEDDIDELINLVKKSYIKLKGSENVSNKILRDAEEYFKYCYNFAFNIIK